MQQISRIIYLYYIQIIKMNCIFLYQYADMELFRWKSILPEASLGRILHGELSPVLCCVSILGRLFVRTRAA